MGTPAPPPRRDIKQLLLWCARCLLPGGGFHRGKLAVTIDYHAENESVSIRPHRELTGLDAPPFFADGHDEHIPYADLIRLFLSDKERAILRAVAQHGPARAKEIEDAVIRAVRRNEFYVLWSNLQIRRLIDEQDDGRFALGWSFTEMLLG